MKIRKSMLVVAAALALVVSAVAATTAGASPAWKFNGVELTTKETLVGAAISSSLTIPGVTTECKHFLYNMKISNAAGKGKGEITELPLFECTTQNKNCTVEAIEPKKLPWQNHLATFGTKNYLIVEGIEVWITYAGELCAFAESPIVLKGTAGGWVDNASQTATFNKTTFEATGTSLKVGATSVEWNGLFPTEAFETHREQTIEVA